MTKIDEYLGKNVKVWLADGQVEEGVLKEMPSHNKFRDFYIERLLQANLHFRKSGVRKIREL